MSNAHAQIIESARANHAYTCPRCGYALSDVQIDASGKVICPECGQSMRFDIVVRLVMDEDEQRRAVRDAMNRRDRMFVLIAIMTLIGSGGILAMILLL